MPPKKKKKANVRGNKGGCLVGRKGETPKGGCKVGKRDPTKEERKAAADAAFKGARKIKVAEDKAKAAPKKPVKKPTSRPKSAPRNQTGGMPKSKLAAKAGIKAGEKLPFKKKPKKKSEPDEYKRKVKVGSSDRVTRSAPAAKGVIKDKAAKKARIQEKVRALGKKQVEKKKEKKKDFTAAPKPKGVPDRIKAKVAKLGKDQAKMKRKVVRNLEDRAAFHSFEFAEDQIIEHHHPAMMTKHERAEFPEGIHEDHLGYLHSEAHSIAGTGGGYSKSRVGFRKSEDHPLVYSKQFQANIDTRKAKSKAEKAPAAASGGGRKPTAAEAAFDKLPNELMGAYGMTAAEANDMSPEKLFGQLAPELRMKVLTGGPKVAQAVSEDRVRNLIDARLKTFFPKGNIHSDKMRKQGNFQADKLLHEVHKRLGKRGADYKTTNIAKTLLKSKSESEVKAILDEFEAGNKRIAEKYAKGRADEKAAKGKEDDVKRAKVKAYIEKNLIGQRLPKNPNYIEGPNNNWHDSYSESYHVISVSAKSVKVKIGKGSGYRETSDVGKIKSVPLLTFMSQTRITDDI